MRFIVHFQELPAMLAVRARLEPAHLAFLDMHKNEIPMAGGLRQEAGSIYEGGLWMFEVTSRERAVELIQADPYYQACPRPYQLLVWGKALPQYDVLV